MGISRVIHSYILSILTVVSILLMGCKTIPNYEIEKNKLLSLHNEQETAHLNLDARQFVNLFANPMLSINKGSIRSWSRDDALARFDNYFKSVTIKEWRDILPPIIDFSDDGSMAYMVVEKFVLLTFQDQENDTLEESSHFAWVSIFKKNDKKEWRIVCNISTEKND